MQQKPVEPPYAYIFALAGTMCEIVAVGLLLLSLLTSTPLVYLTIAPEVTVVPSPLSVLIVLFFAIGVLLMRIGVLLHMYT